MVLGWLPATALKDLDEGIDGLLLQVAMQLPLPTPIAIGMRRERNNGLLRVKRWSKRRAGVVDLADAAFMHEQPEKDTVLVLPYVPKLATAPLHDLAVLPMRCESSRFVA